MTEISFTTTRADSNRIAAIIDRAEKLDIKFDRLTAHMDLSATHANGCLMDYALMLEADDFNFIHDFCGIRRHIDRTTGKLGGFFLPRFAAKQHSGAK